MKINKRFVVKTRNWFKKYKIKIGITLMIILTLALSVSFVKIMDKTTIHRKKPIEYIIVHYTANMNPKADARMNAMYLRNKHNAGTHYCIDDKEVIQCTDEDNVAYAVGDRKWLGFIPKPWLDNKIKNNNSLSFEMCLGGGRNDSLIIERTAQFIGWQLVNKGLDITRVVRHHDVTGKRCPKFVYLNPKTGKPDTGFWDQKAEDGAFWKFRQRVVFYQNIHLKRKNEVKVQQAKIISK